MNSVALNVLGFGDVNQEYGTSSVGLDGRARSLKSIKMLRYLVAPQSNDLASQATDSSRADIESVEMLAEELSAEAEAERRVDVARSVLQLSTLCSWDDRESAERADAAIREALVFLSTFPDRVLLPRASAAPDGVVALEWADGKKKAMALFEGDGEYGYAVFVGDEYKPGRFTGHLDGAVPNDLTGYLSA